MKTGRVKETPGKEKKGRPGIAARNGDDRDGFTDGNERLRDWLDACDPELAVLCILIVQTIFTRPPDYSGLDRYFAENRSELIERAHLGRLRELWERRDWEALEARIQIRGVSPPFDPNMPVVRGLP